VPRINADRRRCDARRVRTWAALAILVAGPGLLSACSKSADPKVIVTSAGPQTLTLQAGGLGQAQAAIDVPVQLGFEAQVGSISVQPGEAVTKGQSLMTISSTAASDPAQVASLQARLDADKASLATDRADLNNATVKASPALLSAHQQLVAAAASRVTLDQQILALAQGQAQTVNAPSSGTVGTISVTSGEVVAASKTVLDIIDYHHLTVVADLPVADINLVAVGDQANVSFTTLSGVSLPGTVTSVSPEAINNGESFQVTLDVANPNLVGRPGLVTYVQVSISHRAAVAVNHLAVLTATGTPEVFVVNNGVAHLRTVTLGVTNGSTDEVLSGLAPGDECVLTGNQGLTDGAKVLVTGHAS
jgi:multidrug efflux system membrane fusion protein